MDGRVYGGDDIGIPCSELISIEVHHGGQLIDTPAKTYVGGKVDTAFYYKVPHCDMTNGLKHVSCDEAIMQMFRCLPSNKLVRVHFVHPYGLLEHGENDPMGSGETNSKSDSEYVEEENQTGLESTKYENIVDEYGMCNDDNEDVEVQWPSSNRQE
ncbi:unnamed protein product [Ilex paraguariensis]|uniref:Uncharacterized protein n=1 Tax=Ilex paraguariensis TaxID=185542 RepID=A0ABC8QZG1_9AQUA